MNRLLYVFVILVIVNIPLAAQMTVSGIFDSSVSAAIGSEFSFGIEEYANLRFQARIKNRASIFGAVNLIAAAGDYAVNAAMMSTDDSPGDSPMNTTAYIAGENYIAAIELERLFFRLNFEVVDLEGGLFRLPFGYSQIWGSSDFLNPKNPLKPDARPRAVLGAGISWYPIDELKFLGFTAAPRNPFSNDGSGMLFGLSIDRHGLKSSVQTLYSYETAIKGFDYGTHRAGVSVKADIEIGLVMDFLYTYNNETSTGQDGLSFSAGVDYSFVDGNLIVLGEYLFNGKTSSTALGHGGNFPDRHYLYLGFTWLFNDFTNMNTALISSFDEISLTPVITLNHELFQGATLTFTTQIPFYRELIINEEDPGKQSSKLTANHVDITVKLRLRF
jgi:hypothetical protein